MKTIDSIEFSKYILSKVGSMNQLKLQKLLYYVNAWHLVFTNTLLFEDEFEAWVHGPVSRKVWDYFKKYSVLYNNMIMKPEHVNSIIERVEAKLSDKQKEIINDVLEEYGDKNDYHLESLTHSEKPWIEARKGYCHGERCDVPIDYKTVKEYYTSLL